MPAKKTLEDARKLAEERGGHCLSGEYTNASIKMMWKCQEDHEWRASYGSIKSGHWCMECARKALAERYRFSFDFVASEIEKRGGLLLSTEYSNDRTKLDIMCRQCSHVWHPVFASVRQGNWCPKCAKDRLSMLFRCPLDNVRAEIERRGGLLLSDHCENERQKLDIRCNICGLVWVTDYQHIKRGRWCIKCSKYKRHTLEECVRHASELGGKCLSAKYVNCKQNMAWECSDEHHWLATFDNITRGKWCPECSIGKSQRLLKEILQRIFCGCKIEENYKGFAWLYNRKTKGTQEIDIWIPQIRLAIEYDGEQHFAPVEYFGGKDKFVVTKKRDRLKNAKMKKHKEDIRWFVRFGYKESEKFDEAYVRERLMKEGVFNGS